MLQIKKILEASKKSSEGAVSAVFDVTWKFAARVEFEEKGDLDGLTEKRLRELLAEKIDEMVYMFTTADEINIGEILEVRDIATDEEIELDGIGLPISG